MRGLPKSEDQRKLEEKYFELEYTYQDDYYHGKLFIGSGWVVVWREKTYFSYGEMDWYILPPNKAPKLTHSQLVDDFASIIFTKMSRGIARKPVRREPRNVL